MGIGLEGTSAAHECYHEPGRAIPALSIARGEDASLGLKIFFDVDYTILSVDSSLRPGTRETFRRLVSDGHQVYVWSGMGVRTSELRKHDLMELVSDVYRKPIQDYVAGLERLGVPYWPDLVIDDYPEIVDTFGGVLVRPYYFRSPADDEMDRVYRIIAEVTATGRSAQVGFRPVAEPPQGT